MIRPQHIWLCTGACDMRSGIDSLLAKVVHAQGQAHIHHAYLFTNARASRLKVLVYDGAGIWLCTRRLQSGSFEWAAPNAAQTHISISAEQFEWLVAGLPWQRRHPKEAITVV